MAIANFITNLTYKKTANDILGPTFSTIMAHTGIKILLNRKSSPKLTQFKYVC